MAKKHKRKSKKGGKSNDLLDEAARSLKKFRRVTKQLTKLSTGQKLVGGVALLAAGLTYLAKSQASAETPNSPAPSNGSEPASPGAGFLADKEATASAGAAENLKKPSKSRKK